MTLGSVDFSHLGWRPKWPLCNQSHEFLTAAEKTLEKTSPGFGTRKLLGSVLVINSLGQQPLQWELWDRECQGDGLAPQAVTLPAPRGPAGTAGGEGCAGDQATSDCHGESLYPDLVCGQPCLRVINVWNGQCVSPRWSEGSLGARF